MIRVIWCPRKENRGITYRVRVAEDVAVRDPHKVSWFDELATCVNRMNNTKGSIVGLTAEIVSRDELPENAVDGISITWELREGLTESDLGDDEDPDDGPHIIRLLANDIRNSVLAVNHTRRVLARRHRARTTEFYGALITYLWDHQFQYPTSLYPMLYEHCA